MREPDTIEVQTLSSGSSGNALFVRTDDLRLLIDAGTSGRRVAQALEALGERPEALSGILVTHEHLDHAAALPALRRLAPDVPIYATRGTAAAWRASYGWRLQYTRISPNRPFRLGEAVVTPFNVRHDARQPVGFRVDLRGFSMGVATDLGAPDRGVRRALAGCQLLVVESNYDGDLLRAGAYPPWLKRRIASPSGHLSNHQTRHLLADAAGPGLRHVVLCHLSAEHNDPARALDTARLGLSRTPWVRLTAAPRHEPGELLRFSLTAVPGAACAAPAMARVQGELPLF